MWGDYGLQMTPDELNKPQIVSKLNPYAKEFYPNYLKSWRVRAEHEEEETSTQIKEVYAFNICEALPAHREDKPILLRTIQGLMAVKYKTSTREEVYGNRKVSEKLKPCRNTKIAIPAIITKSTNSMPGILRKSGMMPLTTKRENVITYKSRVGLNTENPKGDPKKNGIISVAGVCQKQKICKNKLPTLTEPLSTKLSGTSKDTMSMKSDNSCSDKSSISRVSTSSKCLPSKTLRKSSSTPSSSAKTKETTVLKSPRSTVASKLRKTETQKRRNLFPHDPVLNIVMSDFLFK